MKYGIGIDVSKGKSTVAIITSEGEVIEVGFEIGHDEEGIRKLEEKIKKIPKEEIKIVMEQTGSYHLPLQIELKERGYFVVAENALKIKKYLDRGLRKAKTDKKDAMKLAEYAIENWWKLEEVKVEEETYKELRFLSRRYMEQISIQTKGKITFSNLCDLLFPGYYQLLEKNTYVLGLEVFKKYYHPEIVKNKDQSQFIEEIDHLAKKLGHRSAGITFAKKVYNLAQKTISARPNNKYTQLAVECSCIDELIITIKSSNKIITEMNELASTLPEYEEVMKMAGVGETLGPRLIAEIGDIRRLKNAGSLIASAGVDSPPYQSGKYEAKERHISKRGNKYLRKVGYEITKAIMSSCSDNCEIKQYINKKEEEGKPKKVAKIAGVNKILRQYYGIVKRVYKELEIW